MFSKKKLYLIIFFAIFLPCTNLQAQEDEIADEIMTVETVVTEEIITYDHPEDKPTKEYGISDKENTNKYINDDLIIFYEEETWKINDKEGNNIFPYQIKGMSEFKDGVAKINKNGKVGFINKYGEVVIDFLYDEIYFDGNFGLARKGNKWTFIQKNGKKITNLFFDQIDFFSEGLARVYFFNRWGFINEQGKVVIDGLYYDAGSFKNGIAPVKNADKWGCVDKQGNVVIDFSYQEMRNDVASELIFAKREDRWGALNHKGEEFLPFYYQEIRSYQNADYFSVNKGAKLKKFTKAKDGFDEEGMVGGKWAIFDNKGKQITPFTYESIDTIFKNITIVLSNGNWGIFDLSKKKKITDFIYDYIGSFHDGLAVVDKYLYPSKSNSVLLVKKKKSNHISELQYKDNYPYIRPSDTSIKTLFKEKKKSKKSDDEYLGLDPKRGLINLSGEIVLKIDYDKTLWNGYYWEVLKGEQRKIFYQNKLYSVEKEKYKDYSILFNEKGYMAIKIDQKQKKVISFQKEKRYQLFLKINETNN